MSWRLTSKSEIFVFEDQWTGVIVDENVGVVFVHSREGHYRRHCPGTRGKLISYRAAISLRIRTTSVCTNPLKFCMLKTYSDWMMSWCNAIWRRIIIKESIVLSLHVHDCKNMNKRMEQKAGILLTGTECQVLLLSFAGINVWILNTK